MTFLLVLLVIGGCQPPAAPSNASSAVNALETSFSDTPAPAKEGPDSAAQDSDSVAGAVPADSDFGDANEVENPFGLISPAFQGIGLQTYSTACDPFDEAYGTCL